MFLGYFHPDWRLNAESRQEVVADFLATAQDADIRRVVEELTELLAEPLEESELHTLVLSEYSLFYDPWRDELTMREWLEGLRRELLTTPPKRWIPPGPQPHR